MASSNSFSYRAEVQPGDQATLRRELAQLSGVRHVNLVPLLGAAWGQPPEDRVWGESWFVRKELVSFALRSCRVCILPCRSCAVVYEWTDGRRLTDVLAVNSRPRSLSSHPRPLSGQERIQVHHGSRMMALGMVRVARCHRPRVTDTHYSPCHFSTVSSGQHPRTGLFSEPLFQVGALLLISPCRCCVTSQTPCCSATMALVTIHVGRSCMET